MILYHFLHRIRYEVVTLAFIFCLPSIVLAQPFGSSPPLQPVTVIAKHDAYPLRLPAVVRPDEVAVRSSTIQINFNPGAIGEITVAHGRKRPRPQYSTRHKFGRPISIRMLP